jgi:predicted ribosome quality control (RQC) complex YloA/Tae2 family protein
MMKKSLSSISVRKVVEEASVLQGAFFQKAYQLDYGTIVLRFAIRKDLLQERGKDRPFIRNILSEEEENLEGISLGEGGGNYARFDLYIKMGGFLFFSPNVSSDMPRDPSHFAMKLRKSLSNRILKDISQVSMDRIVVLTFNPLPGEEEDRKLYLELFGDGNAIIVKGGVIETAFTSRSWSSRTVKKGEVFSPPPSGPNPFQVTRDEFDIFLASSTEDLIRFLIRKINLPPAYAEELCLRAGIEKKLAVSALDDDQKEDIWSVLNGMLVELEGDCDTLVYFHRGEPSILEPFFLSSFFGVKDHKKAFTRFSESSTKSEEDHFKIVDSINTAIESYMFEETAPLPESERRKERAVDRLEKLLHSQKKALEEREEQAESAKIQADALYMHYQEIDTLLKNFDPEISHHSITSYFPGKRGGGKIKVKIATERGDEEVELDLDMDINQNAEGLYQFSKKARSKMEGIKKAIRMTEDKIEKVRKADSERAEEIEERKRKLRKFWFENFRWCFSSTGIMMIAGRDAKTNERVVKKYMRDNDIYAHADISGAASVVIRAEKEREVDEESKLEGCHLSVLHSKAWNAKVGSAGAYWVVPDQVSRTAQSGEFIAKGSFIIRGKKNMVDKLPLVGAAGIVYVEGVPKVMFGPETAIVSMCNGNFFRLRPGMTKKSEIVKLVISELGGELEQVMSVLPADSMDAELVRRNME